MRGTMKKIVLIALLACFGCLTAPAQEALLTHNSNLRSGPSSNGQDYQDFAKRHRRHSDLKIRSFWLREGGNKRVDGMGVEEKRQRDTARKRGSSDCAADRHIKGEPRSQGRGCPDLSKVRTDTGKAGFAGLAGQYCREYLQEGMVHGFGPTSCVRYQ